MSEEINAGKVLQEALIVTLAQHEIPEKKAEQIANTVLKKVVNVKYNDFIAEAVNKRFNRMKNANDLNITIEGAIKKNLDRYFSTTTVRELVKTQAKTHAEKLFNFMFQNKE